MRHEETLGRASKRSVPAFDFSGEWTSDLSSTMDVVQEGGVVTGVYTSPVSGEDRDAIGQLSGYAHGDLIGFTVKWHSLAITSWVGRRRAAASEDIIETLWHMTTLDDDGPDGARHSVYAGADRFTRPTERQDTEPLMSGEAGDRAEVPAA